MTGARVAIPICDGAVTLALCVCAQPTYAHLQRIYTVPHFREPLAGVAARAFA